MAGHFGVWVRRLDAGREQIGEADARQRKPDATRVHRSFGVHGRGSARCVERAGRSVREQAGLVPGQGTGAESAEIGTGLRAGLRVGRAILTAVSMSCHANSASCARRRTASATPAARVLALPAFRPRGRTRRLAGGRASGRRGVPARRPAQQAASGARSEPRGWLR